MKINPYLSFDGRCREAFEFYEDLPRANRLYPEDWRISDGVEHAG